MNPKDQYKIFREDGWPFCPRCEEDELFSVAHLRYFGEGPQPTLEEGINSGMMCYQCGWQSKEYQENFEGIKTTKTIEEQEWIKRARLKTEDD